MLVGACLLAIGLAGAEGAPAPTYRDVKGVFKAQCFKCHSPEERRGGLDLTNYGTTMKGSTSGPIVVKGKPDESLLYLVVSHQEEPRMPPGSPKMPKDRLDLIKEWIASGAPETAADVVASAPAAPSAPVPVPETTARTFHRPTALTALAASPDGSVVAVSDQGRIVLLDGGLAPKAVLPFPEGEAYALRFSADGKSLLAGGGKHGASGTVALFDVATGQRLGAYGEESDVVLAADLSADGRLVALGGPGRTVSVYDVATGRRKHLLKRHADWAVAVAFGAGGLLLATSDRAGNTFVYESESGALVHSLRGHDAAVTALGWSPTGDHLVTAGEDGKAIVWDAHSGTIVRSWTAHAPGALALCVATDGTIATTGRDKRVATWKGLGESPGVAFGPDDALPLVLAPLAKGGWAVGDGAGRLVSWDASGVKVGTGVEPIRSEAATLASGPPRVVSTDEEEAPTATAAPSDLPALLGALKAQRAQVREREAQLDEARKALEETLRRLEALAKP